MRYRFLLAFAFVIAISGCHAYGQTEEGGEPHRKWLECDVVWGFSDWEVGSNFSLKVSSQGAPVAGARMRLDREGKVLATTNSQGLARFASVPPGEYSPREVDGLAFPIGSTFIKVVSGHALGEKVPIEWPAQSISVRALSGRLTASKNLDDPNTPLQGSKVELLDLRTGSLIESAATNIDGMYDFSETKSGLYALRVTPTPLSDKIEPKSREIAVELTSMANDGTIPEMKVLQSECNGVQLLRKIGENWEVQ